MVRMRFATATLCLAGLALAAAPSADIFRPSKEDQVKLGQRASESIRKEEKILPDTHPRVLFLRRVANKVLDAIPAKEREKEIWKFSFDVIDSKDVNAFARPGGPIYFFNGLIDKMETEDQLAGVLAHEITHIRNQHWASSYADTMKRRMGLTLVLTLLNANDTMFSVAGVADELIFNLPYSRKHETESDRVGFDLVVKAGYNPRGLADMMRVFAKEGGKTPEFVSTHPEPGKRADAIERRAGELKVAVPEQRPLPANVRQSANGQGVKAGTKGGR